MHTKEIEVFRIAKTAVQHDEVERWLKSLGCSEEAIERHNGPQASEGAGLINLAGRRCYLSFEPGLNPNVTRVREELFAYFDNVLKSGHGSVLEHATYSFAIEGVTRVFTGEMNRHRAGWAISEGSMRYIRFSDIPYWLPLSIREDSADDDELAEKKLATRAAFERVFQKAQDEYADLVKMWDLDNPENNMPFSQKKALTSMMRRIIPMGVSTGGIWTGNLRAMRHVVALRTDAAAEEEIAAVFCAIATILRAEEPEIFQDFTLNQTTWTPNYPKV